MKEPGKTATPRNHRTKKEKDKNRRASDLHFMVARGVGKVRSFSVSPHILLGSLIFFSVYVVASLFVINAYFHELRTNRSQSQKLERLQLQIQNSRKSLYRSRQRLVILEGYVQKAKSGDKAAEEISRPEIKQVKGDDPPASFQPDNEVKERSLEPEVQIRDLATRREEEKLTVRFKIAKTAQNDTPLRGYVHIIATDKKSDPPQWWTYPKVALRDGFPIDYKRGRLFVIKHFRTIKGEYFLDSKTDSPISLRILAYDESGELLLQKEFELENSS
jgi:hypothetical protein